MEKMWRENVIETAREYANFVWFSNIQNIYHGVDEKGVMINTPDEAYNDESDKCGWWKTAKANRGMPYKWGGYSTIDDFMKGISVGKYAGNVPKERESKLADDCVGLDGSGLVSICWGLDRKYSTVDLFSICEPVENIHNMSKGDIFLKPGKHVMLFVRMIDNDNAEIIDCTKSTGRTMERVVSVKELLGDGYGAYRRFMVK